MIGMPVPTTISVILQVSVAEILSLVVSHVVKISIAMIIWIAQTTIVHQENVITFISQTVSSYGLQQ